MTVKLLTLVVAPAGVVTATVPVVAPAGTVALILIGETTLKEAAEPLNLTEVAPVKFAPLIVTLDPITPLGGERLVMRGATVKLVALVATPPGVVTVMGPVSALPGTVIVIWVAESTVKGALRPLSLTEVVLPRFVPVMATLTPIAPLPGEKLLIAGVKLTVKLFAVVTVPPAVVTAMGPVVAPVGTMAVIFTDVLTVKAAAVPLNVTDDAPAKLVPLMATLVPVVPVDGVKLVIRGATMKLAALVAVPPGDVVTTIVPVFAVAGTVAVIWVGPLTLNAALMPLNRTEETPAKLAPLMVTLAPGGPFGGVNPVIRGATVKLLALAAVAVGVVTRIGPVVALAGTMAVIRVPVLIV